MKRTKRTNLVLVAETLQEALKVSGERTYSAAVNRALEEFVRRARAGRILSLAGSGLWEGSISEMRGDTHSSGGPPRNGGRRRGTR